LTFHHLIDKEMISQLPISVVEIPEEFQRIYKDVERKITILRRKHGGEEIDITALVSDHFFLQDGQRFVKYEGDLDHALLRSKILLGYPKLKDHIVRVIEVETKEDEIFVPLRPVISTPFMEVSDFELQSISIAPAGAEFDFALKIEPPRTLEKKIIEGEAFLIEMWNKRSLDIVHGPGREEKKPYSYRRALLQKMRLPLVPMIKTKTKEALYIRDEDPYNAGGRGGYFKFSINKEIAVERDVQQNRYDLYVVGSLSSGNEKTLIRTGATQDSPGVSKVLMNLTTMTIVSSSSYVNDIIDYYNVENCLPRSLADIYLRTIQREEELLVSSFSCFFQGAVVGIGFRRKLYDLFFGTRVRMKIKNVKTQVYIEGYVPSSEFLSLRFKLESVAYAIKAVIKWNPIEEKLQDGSVWLIEIGV